MISGAITEYGSLYVWGMQNTSTPKKIMEHVVLVDLGVDHSGAITEDGRLYMWGFNSYGQLGDGTEQDAYIFNKNVEKSKINTIAHVQTYRTLISGQPTLSINKIGSLIPSGFEDEVENRRASFENLKSNAVYNFYVVKNKAAESLLNTSNLLFLTQAIAGADGSLHVSYGTKENSENAEIFVACAEQDDIASATINIHDLEYNQKQQYIQPVVTYQGKTLNEYEDYELLGDYSATEIGNYTVTIHGIGDYKGSINASYKICLLVTSDASDE